MQRCVNGWKLILKSYLEINSELLPVSCGLWFEFLKKDYCYLELFHRCATQLPRGIILLIQEGEKGQRNFSFPYKCMQVTLKMKSKNQNQIVHIH